MTHRGFADSIDWKRLAGALAVALIGMGLLAAGTTAVLAQEKKTPAPSVGPDTGAAKKKFKIYWNLSLTSGGWISAATNAVKALAATPPYDNMVDLEIVISGLDIQKQISDYESMIASRPDAIISMPFSATAINRAVRRGCDKGILMFMVELTSTEPCAYNVSTVTSGFGENGAQALVNMLNGKGKVFVNRIVPGFMAEKRHYDGAMHIFKKYPGIEVVAEYYGEATDEKAQAETAKTLAAHPDVAGIFSTPGEFGVLKAVIASGREKLIPIVGEGSNGFRLALADPALQKRGLRGVSSGGTPATAGYAFKLVMEVLTKQRTLNTHNIEYPLPWVAGEQVRICTGDRFENGCNVFPASKVPDTFFTEVLSPIYLPELTLISALEGKPTPGATIQKLPDKVVQAPDTPGLNCQKCKPNQYRLFKVKPTVNP
jgi:ribose transport system substrate-binding protein